MTVELIAVYELAPDARPSPLAPGARYLLARHDDRQPVGCCAVQPLHGEALWELNRMYVVPEMRGAGVSLALLDHAEQVVQGLGGERIRLETGVRQPSAMRLYERSGYHRIANYPPHEHDPLSRCYEKTLTTRE